MIDYSDYLSTTEAARLLGINVKTVQRWAKSGTLPSVRIGRLYKINPEDLRNFVEKDKAEGRTPEEWKKNFPEEYQKHQEKMKK